MEFFWRIQQRKDVRFWVLLQIEIEIGVTQLQNFDSFGMTSLFLCVVASLFCAHIRFFPIYSEFWCGLLAAFKARSFSLSRSLTHLYITAPQAALCLLNERISLLLEIFLAVGEWNSRRAHVQITRGALCNNGREI